MYLKETLNGLKRLDISLICFKEKEISSSFTKISAVIKIITPNSVVYKYTSP